MDSMVPPGQGLFDRDLSQIPCFRQTFLYSICSGLGTGILYFLATSKVQQATRLAVGAYAVVTLGYWSQCRYNFSVEKFETGKLRKALQDHAMFEGTEAGKKVKNEKSQDI